MAVQKNSGAESPGGCRVKRISLAVQVADILREQLRKGRWGKRLPAERALTWELGVSRSTLRQAFDILRDEGILETKSRRDTRPVPGQAPLRACPSRNILFLSTIEWDRFPYFELSFLHQLRCHLYLDGYVLMAHMRDPGMGRGMARSLQSLLVNIRPDACILHHASPAMQHWFQDSGMPTLICGRRYEGIRLPMIALNQRAVVRHATGLLLGRGCRLPALLWPDSEERESEPAVVGYRQALAQHHGRLPIHPRIARHDQTPDAVEQALDKLLAATPPPDGFIVSDPRHALLLRDILRAARLDVPRDISLLCASFSPFLEYVRPSMAHYVYHPVSMAKKVARTTVLLAQAKPVDGWSNLITGRFVEGETLPPRRAAK